MPKFRITAFLLLASLVTSVTSAQDSRIQQARTAFERAEEKAAELRQIPAVDRTKSDYTTVVNLYRRVYLITPRTSFADNALVAIAALLEESGDQKGAARALEFLIREYPTSPLIKDAKDDLARLETSAPVAVPPPSVKSAEKKVALVENIRYWEATNSVRVVVDLTGEISFKPGEARNPDRVFVDISPAKLESTLTGKQWPVKLGLLEQVRVGQYEASTVRVVLDVVRLGRVNVFPLREPDRLVIDIQGGETVTAASSSPSPAAPAKTAAAASPPSTPPAGAVKDPPAESKPPAAIETRVATPARPTDRGNQTLIRSLGLKIGRVVIDPGHGGHDTGSISSGGVQESELVLDVSLRLKELVEKELGAEVVMTRANDTFIPLENRTGLANQESADLFLSIHANSSRVRSARGVETYYLSFTNRRDNLETAARENASSLRSVHELQDLVKKIVMTDKVDESREFASKVQKALTSGKPAPQNRGVRQAPFVVLIGANMPSILAEICFLSNQADDKLAATPAYRQKIADALFEGVRSYAESLSGFKTVKIQQ